MSLVETAIVTKAFSELSDLFKKEFSKNDDRSKQTLKVIVVQKPDTFSYSKLIRATTTIQSKSTTPQIEIKNPLDVDVVVKQISVIADSVFKTKGIVEIHVNDVPFFESENAGDFTDVVDLVVKSIEGKTIKRNDKVKFFFWNGADVTSIGFTVLVTFSEAD